jgi:hypothetical protein
MQSQDTEPRSVASCGSGLPPPLNVQPCSSPAVGPLADVVLDHGQVPPLPLGGDCGSPGDRTPRASAVSDRRDLITLPPECARPDFRGSPMAHQIDLGGERARPVRPDYSATRRYGIPSNPA